MKLANKTYLKILSIVCFTPCIIAYLNLPDERTKYSILISALISVLGYIATKKLIPLIKQRTLKAGLYGMDINKRGSKEGEKKIPESLGLAPGMVFLVCIVLFQQLHYHDAASIVHWLKNGGSWRDIFDVQVQRATDAWLVDYNAALATICFMLFLGFADDVLDIPWRVKLVLPTLASLPLLIAYSGGTGVVVPKPVRATLNFLLEKTNLTSISLLQHVSVPSYVELGPLYKVYMILLVIFCANSINILAGVNGLEAGQTFVIACAVLFHNLHELGGYSATVQSIADGHLFSVYLMLPLIATTLALLYFNWYPSQVFVGDTFTYFAGMTLAVAGILGHFSETLLVFFIPQIINFVYSLPQLFKLVPCPRHRLPRFEPETGLLHATPNWNLVNLVLQVMGPCSELMLCVRLLVFQVVCCVFGFVARWLLAGVYK